MNSMPSPSQPPHDSAAPAWLVAQVYTPRRQRTVDLVRCALTRLAACKARISLATLAAATRAADPAGQGVSESAILTNPAAYQLYAAQRTWQGTATRRRAAPPAAAPVPAVVRPIKGQRDVARAHHRYLRLSKATLAARLVATEQAYAEVHARWLAQADTLLVWQLRARAAEQQVAEQTTTHSTREHHDAAM
jgi:hypothetical protein